MIEVLLFGLSINRGGIETYIEKIWNNIDHRHFHFNFIDMTGDGNKPYFFDELCASGCTFYKITPRNISIIKNHKEIRKLFSNNHFDILHFNVNTLSYLYPVEIAMKAGCKVIIHSRSSGSFKKGKNYLAFFHEINKHRLLKMNVSKIAVSEKAGKWLFGENDNFVVYNNGVDTSKYRFKKQERARLKLELGIGEKKVVGHVGAFLPVKNHYFVVDTFYKYYQKYPNSILLLIGDGYLQNDIKEYVYRIGLKDHVLFLGMRDDLTALYSVMDILLLPSLFEGFPNVILEAQSEGLPCLISDVITPEVIVLESCEAIPLYKGPQFWADCIAEAIRREDTRENSYKIIEDKGFSCREEVERLERLYYKLANKAIDSVK